MDKKKENGLLGGEKRKPQGKVYTIDQTEG